MKHRKILNTAVFAAKVAAGGQTRDLDADTMAGLYDYARQRNFPPPETLARKFGELVGMPFELPSIEAADEDLQVFFVTFRAVAQALDPFHEDAADDDEDDDELALVSRAELEGDPGKTPATPPQDDKPADDKKADDAAAKKTRK